MSRCVPSGDERMISVRQRRTRSVRTPKVITTTTFPDGRGAALILEYVEMTTMTLDEERKVRWAYPCPCPCRQARLVTAQTNPCDLFLSRCRCCRFAVYSGFVWLVYLLNCQGGDLSRQQRERGIWCTYMPGTACSPFVFVSFCVLSCLPAGRRAKATFSLVTHNVLL